MYNELFFMIKIIQAKSILSSLRSSEFDPFGISYNMNIYRGCQHQCIYCDSRSDCYHIENFADILIKENAIALLKKELASKKKIATIGTGSMNDPYMPIEKELKLTRKALDLIRQFHFPIHIITKSDLVTRDIDLLKDISKVYAAVSLSITTFDNNLSNRIEPGAPSSSARLKAIETLAKNDIYCGVLISPVLPYITDSIENIELLLNNAHNAGSQYVLMWPGLTQRQGQREWYYEQLDKYFPGIKEKYIDRFGNRYECDSPNARKINTIFYDICQKLHLATSIKFYEPVDPQINLF